MIKNLIILFLIHIIGVLLFASSSNVDLLKQKAVGAKEFILKGKTWFKTQEEESSPPEKNNNEESWGHWTDEEYLDEVFEYDSICKRCGKGKEGHKVIAVMARKFADCISNPIHGTEKE